MLTIGKKAPAFSCDAVIEGAIKKISLDDFDGQYKVLFFYPLDFTFVCPTELHAFQECLEEFKKRNVAVIGCSIDSAYSHTAWLRTPKQQGGIAGVSYPLLADINKAVAKAYGVLDEEQGVALRGLFIIDTNGVVQCASVNNLPLGRNVQEVLRLVDALQFSEKNGQVCPANWQQGHKAMVPNDKGLVDYFAE